MSVLSSLLILVILSKSISCGNVFEVELECPSGWKIYSLTGYRKQTEKSARLPSSLCVLCFNTKNAPGRHVEACANDFEIAKATATFGVTPCNELESVKGLCQTFYNSSFCQLRMTVEADSEGNESVTSATVKSCGNDVSQVEPGPTHTDLLCPDESEISDANLRENRYYTFEENFYFKSYCIVCKPKGNFGRHYTVCSSARLPKPGDALMYTVKRWNEFAASESGKEEMYASKCGYKLLEGQKSFLPENLLRCKWRTVWTQQASLA